MGQRKPSYFAITCALLMGACTTENVERPEIHGHRGCRGLKPENTLPAFLKAAELGCDWLELDVVITGDSQVLVSHEPWMEHRICLTSDGDTIPASTEREVNIYRMTLQQVQDFDCGSARHPDFPRQENEETYKPTLREVVEAVDELAMQEGLGQIGYNIEIKSDPALYGTHQPEPARFAQLVLAQIDTLGLSERCIIQSFDPALLKQVHEQNGELPLALLVDNVNGLEANLASLPFLPQYYSPAVELVNKELVRTLRETNIGILVWTVNDKDDMKRMIKFGVDGIITDYPDKLIALLEEDD